MGERGRRPLIENCRRRCVCGRMSPTNGTMTVLVYMATATMKRTGRGIWPMFALFLLLLVSLKFRSDATHNPSSSAFVSLLLLTNCLGLVVLIGLDRNKSLLLLMQYRRRAAGARLTSRLVLMFVVLAVVPVSVVYYFSLQFLQRASIAWFNVQIEASLEDGHGIGQSLSMCGCAICCI